MEKYTLECGACGATVEQKNPFDFTAPCHDDSLLKVRYKKTVLKPRSDLPGLWKYIDWLPVEYQPEYTFGPVTYKSNGLANELGLSNLWFSFNGYYPDLQAYYKTCTFKELHAVVAISHARQNGIDKLVLASAGNTAVAFIYMAEILKFPVVLIVPETCMCGVNIPNMLIEHSKVIMLTDGDYSDAIDIAKRLSKIKNYKHEGGCQNYARRAGLGMPYLDAAVTIGRIPDHYFQAVGSGGGAIAAWEANELLKGDGSYGSHLSKLHLSQNLPMTPMLSAWNAGRNYIDPEIDIPKIDNILDVVAARVLSTKYPCYGVSGGVYDALRATGGMMYGITNDEVYESKELFKRVEGPDILPASCVALTSLIKAVREKRVRRDDTILLNLTGAGTEQRLRDLFILQMKPALEITRDITDTQLKALNV